MVRRSDGLSAIAAVVLASLACDARSQDAVDCTGLPSYDDLRAALQAAVQDMRTNGYGLGNDMWATVVNRDGQVCLVTRSGDDRAGQWPGSRVISAQKANTANAFSLEGTYPNVGAGRSLATGNLYGLVLEGGSLYGLQFSNPVDTGSAYGDPSAEGQGGADRYGSSDDPLVGSFIGGVNVFGGGLGLYEEGGNLAGALGVSGDTSCADHIIAWKVRDTVDLDSIPGGVGPSSTDNLILVEAPAANTFEHPVCGFGEEEVVEGLPSSNPPE